MSVEITVVISVLGFVVTCLSVALAVMTFTRNRGKDSNLIESRLTRIETDVLYIRNSLEANKDWKDDVECRLRNVEIAQAKEKSR